jgi:hypothetical protein
MATGTDAAFEGSAIGDAVIFTVGGEGAKDGAVYTPPGEIVPQTAPLQPDPETLQEIARFGFEFAVGTSVAV